MTETPEHPLLVTARSAPERPGVYRFLDRNGRVLYVGKARVLRRRVLSYFRRTGLAERTRRMMALAAALDFTVTSTEVEALVLENTLIKRHRPRFNVLLRDDKTYPYLRVTTGERWPRVELTRTVREGDGHTSFGPFMGHQMARRLMELARTRFAVRTCALEIDGSLERPCLYHDMGACLAPCVAGMTTEAAYREAVDELLLFLSGRHGELLPRLEAAMWEAAREEAFERAARLRDLVAIVRRLRERQDVEQPGQGDADVFAVHADGEHATVCVLPFRSGKLVDKREFHFEGVGDVGAGELLAAFLPQFYGHNPEVPGSVELAHPVERDEREVLERWLRERRGRAVRLVVPRRGAGARRVELAVENARSAFDLRFRRADGAGVIGRRLGEVLGLPGPVDTVECFDISHASGKATVASCVVWRNGRMARREYRTFTIRGVEGVDDFAAIAEAVGRRYRRLRDENRPLPGLVLIDGGAGQLNAARAAVAVLGLELPMAALAKREELVWLPERDEPLEIDRSDPVHLLLRRIRDEAHRFAVSRHRRRRRKTTLTTELLAIPGVGPARARALLTRFGSVRGVEGASIEELRAVLGPRLAARVHRALHPEAD